MTDFAALIATVHVAPETASHPLHPLKRTLGLAVSVTVVSMMYGSEQSLPQLIPDGLELTVPFAAATPVLLTVSTNRFRSKTAVTSFDALMVTLQVVPEGASHPFQPTNVELAAALAVSVTLVPLSYTAEQTAPQSIPVGLEATLPVPTPA